MKHFKQAIIATAIILGLALIIGIAGCAWILSSEGSTRIAEQRAGMLGGGLGTLAMIAIAPFWILAAARLGKERRAALEKPKAKASKRI